MATYVGTSGVSAGIRAKVDVGTLELLGLTIAVKGNHAVPKVLNLLIDEVGKTSVDIARADGVDTGKVSPGDAVSIDVGGKKDVWLLTTRSPSSWPCECNQPSRRCMRSALVGSLQSDQTSTR